MRRTNGKRVRDERGTVLVEAAMIIMPFFFLIFGVIEVGMQMGGMHSVTGAVKSGSRSASTAGNDLSADFLILQSIKNELQGMPTGLGQVTHIVIYTTTGSGSPPTTQCRNGNAVRDICNVYVVADLDLPATEFGCQSSSRLDGYWCPTDRKTALTAESGGPPGFIGVYIQARHRTLITMVGTDKSLSDHSVNRLEPSRR